MPTKVSKPNMSRSIKNNGVPALVLAYKHVMLKTFGTRVFVRKKLFPKFLKRQEELDALGVSYKRYASVTIKTWKRWCEDHGMTKSMPVNLFCGPKALETFEWTLDRATALISTVSEDEHDAEVCTELEIAFTYIAFGGDVPLDELYANMDVAECSWDAFDDVMDTLCDRFGVPNAMSYDDIIAARRING